MGLGVDWIQGAETLMRAAGHETFLGHLKKGQIYWEGGCGTCDFWQVLNKGSVHGRPWRGSRVHRSSPARY